jgi:Zn-dependent protease with chaperone function/tetratricopeptide (TPR) repeat protein
MSATRSPRLRAALALGVAVLCGGQPLSAQGTPPNPANPDLFRKSLEVAQQALLQYGELDRPDELRRVAEVGYRVVQQARLRQQFPVSFYLVDMAEPNAFALPGGQVFLTRGMLDLGLDDDMLATLLGHEIAHVALQHGVRMQRRATLLNVLSQAALVGVLLTAERNRDTIYDPYGRVVDDGGGDLVQGTAAAGLIVSELLLRSYSREFEDEADEEGQRWAAAAGFDPDGYRRLMAVMSSRLPQDKRYGYWQTHPFLESRVSAATARGSQLKVQEAKPADALRRETQASLLTYAKTIGEDRKGPQAGPSARPDPRFGPEPPATPAERLTLEGMLERAALVAWPSGEAAERLRRERLERLRQREAAEAPLRRDYGRLLRAWADETAAVRQVSPESPLLAVLERESGELEAEAAALYPQAQQVLRGAIYETSFLELFLSNYPEAPEVARVAFELGEAYGRLGRESEAVSQYLRAVEAAAAAPPESAPGADGARALAGLRALAPELEELAGLQQLVDQERDPELARLAAERLAALAASFRELSNGADYLKRFPEAAHAPQVSERLNSLAQGLYGEMVLYQAVGDHVKALERIHKILTYAPLSPAADRLRERVVVQG